MSQAFGFVIAGYATQSMKWGFQILSRIFEMSIYHLSRKIKVILIRKQENIIHFFGW